MEWPILTVLQIVATPASMMIAYFLGRKKNRAEIEKLVSEKKSVEAAAGLSTAEAASIIATAAAEIVQPLMDRIRELQQQNQYLQRKVAELEEIVRLRTEGP